MCVAQPKKKLTDSAKVARTQHYFFRTYDSFSAKFIICLFQVNNRRLIKKLVNFSRIQPRRFMGEFLSYVLFSFFSRGRRCLLEKYFCVE